MFDKDRSARSKAEKAIGAVLAVSVKLMVLSFILGPIQPVLSQIKFSGTGEIKLNEMIVDDPRLRSPGGRGVARPRLASDLLAASPSLSMASVGQHVTSAVSSAANAASGAVSAGLGATGSAASMVRTGATGLAGAAGRGARRSRTDGGRVEIEVPRDRVGDRPGTMTSYFT